MSLAHKLPKSQILRSDILPFDNFLDTVFHRYERTGSEPFFQQQGPLEHRSSAHEQYLKTKKQPYTRSKKNRPKINSKAIGISDGQKLERDLLKGLPKIFYIAVATRVV